jgi:hypothetical protein
MGEQIVKVSLHDKMPTAVFVPTYPRTLKCEKEEGIQHSRSLVISFFVILAYDVIFTLPHHSTTTIQHTHLTTSMTAQSHRKSVIVILKLNRIFGSLDLSSAKSVTIVVCKKARVSNKSKTVIKVKLR